MPILRDVLTYLFLLIGTVFCLIAGLGILRMPDLFLRMSMTTKAGTIGIGSLMIACMIHFDESAAIAKAFAIIIFMLITSPVSAHMIGRAGYLDRDVTLWSKTHTDQFKSYAFKQRPGRFAPDDGAEHSPSK
ncbi:MAG TPA: monovalent cation/H(+) antiporter subunit G [Aggregatilinea sp.]|jgi:multicomponent Na+:H+ antiporter subunit G|uniref:monovalent cation/H(+) antiporter subunit G n=1 Tax=Aggregatilinea sp. TaxID=2806333 RepID=UPI002D0CC50E|nr:monovalent cation/H(+) antiporter subunit G [Aggregatilinea sp.]HML20656.1 monovalent cation/H(+) antiporter subunit G [Aggregatilinea sp.]